MQIPPAGLTTPLMCFQDFFKRNRHCGSGMSRLMESLIIPNNAESVLKSESTKMATGASFEKMLFRFDEDKQTIAKAYI